MCVSWYRMPVEINKRYIDVLGVNRAYTKLEPGISNDRTYIRPEYNRTFRSGVSCCSVNVDWSIVDLIDALVSDR